MSKETGLFNQHLSSEYDVIAGDVASICAVGGSDIIVANITGGIPQIDNDPSPLLSPHNPIMQVLQHERDFYECFVIAGFTHLGMEGIDKVQSKLTKKRLPLKVRMGVGVALAASLLGIAETDLGHGYMGTPDLKDIPAGVVGTIAYPLIDYKLRKKFLESEETKLATDTQNS